MQVMLKTIRNDWLLRKTRPPSMTQALNNNSRKHLWPRNNSKMQARLMLTKKLHQWEGGWQDGNKSTGESIRRSQQWGKCVLVQVRKLSKSRETSLSEHGPNKDCLKPNNEVVALIKNEKSWSSEFVEY